jgi:hypothetical protein
MHNYSLVKKLNNRLADARKEAARLQTIINTTEQIAIMVDGRPLQQFETSANVWAWENSVSFHVYYVTPSIRDMVEVIEYFETRLGVECSSEDNPNEGTRTFKLYANHLGIDIYLIVTPDEEHADATCHKVLVGMDTDTRTVKTPRYEIRCD